MVRTCQLYTISICESSSMGLPYIIIIIKSIYKYSRGKRRFSPDLLSNLPGGLTFSTGNWHRAQSDWQNAATSAVFQPLHPKCVPASLHARRRTSRRLSNTEILNSHGYIVCGTVNVPCYITRKNKTDKNGRRNQDGRLALAEAQREKSKRRIAAGHRPLSLILIPVLITLKQASRWASTTDAFLRQSFSPLVISSTVLHICTCVYPARYPLTI